MGLIRHFVILLFLSFAVVGLASAAGVGTFSIEQTAPVAVGQIGAATLYMDNTWQPLADDVWVTVTWDGAALGYISTDWKVGDAVSATLTGTNSLFLQMADFTNKYGNGRVAVADINFKALATGTSPMTITVEHVRAHSGADETSFADLTPSATAGASSFQVGESSTPTVATPPGADYTYSPAAPIAGGVVQFADTSINGPTTWLWDFGDGALSHEQNPAHTYAETGTYDVGLVASNTAGSDIANRTITVSSRPGAPVASFTVNSTTGAAPLTVAFTDTSTTAPPTLPNTMVPVTSVPMTTQTVTPTHTVTPAASSTTVPTTMSVTTTSSLPPLFRSWDFGDGTTSTEQNPTHTFAAPGTYTVVLTVTNSYGSDTATVTLTVGASPNAPVADFTWSPDPPVATQAVQFTDTSTNAPTSWFWDFGDGTVSQEQNPEHTFTTPGPKEVRLTGTNENGSDTTNITIIVQAPVDAPYLFAGQFGSEGIFDGHFGQLQGIAVNDSGYIYVADPNMRIQVFTSSGTFLSTWGSPGIADGQFQGPQSIDFDSAGNVYVTDAGNHRVQKFTPDGRFISKWGTQGWDPGYFYDPLGLAIDSDDNVYVSDYGNGRVQKFTSDGTLILAWGGFADPREIAIDQADNVYVTEARNDRVQKFTPSGEYITSWGTSGTGNGQFSHPTGITIDTANNVFVSDSFNHRIQKFSSDGAFLTAWGTYGSGEGELNSPWGIATDGAGNIYVADMDNYRVQIFNQRGYEPKPPVSAFDPNVTIGIAPLTVAFRDASTNKPTTWLWDFGDGSSSTDQNPIHTYSTVGTFTVEMVASNSEESDTAERTITVLGGPATLPSYLYHSQFGNVDAGDAQIQEAYGVAVNRSGDILVADTTDNRIKIYTATGEYVTAIGSPGSGDGQFAFPYSIAVDSADAIYVADLANQRVQKFDSSGAFVTTWGGYGTAVGQFDYPHDVAVDSAGYVYVVEEVNNRVQKFDADGTFITTWGRTGDGEGQFLNPGGIAIDNEDHVYVTDSSNCRVQKFASDGTFLTKWGSGGTGKAEFINPEGIAVDESGNVFVTDYEIDRIQVFTSDGAYLTEWGSSGSGDGQVSGPFGIDIGPDGKVYVADAGNRRIQVFTSYAVDPTPTPAGMPIANFTWSPPSPMAEQTVQFTDASNDDTGIAAWRWDFGDGALSGTRNPNHIYSVAGDYTVNLSVTDTDGNTAINARLIRIGYAPPQARFGFSPATVTAGDTVTFTDASTVDEGSIIAWNWRFGDGGASSDQNPSHAYGEAGTCTVDLTVTDSNGGSDTAYWPLVVNAPGETTFALVPPATVEGGHVTIETGATAQESVTVSGDTIQVAMNNLTMTIVTDGLTAGDGTVAGDIVSVSVENDPVLETFSDAGTVAASFDAVLAEIGSAYDITASISETADPGVESAYELVATNEGLEIVDIAYAFNIAGTSGMGVVDANITMTADAAWVDAMGGADNVTIFRKADDGTTEMLETDYTCDPPTYTFTGYSPNGLSIFGLAGVKDSKPVIRDVAVTPNPLRIGEGATLTATVDDTDTGGSPIASVEYSLDGTTWRPMAAEDNTLDGPREAVTAVLPPFSAPAVAGVWIRAEDDDEVQVVARDQVLLAVYDPEGGFVTGGGWITSPAGAYAPDPAMTGKANFGFVSKYRKGATVPEGQTQFVFSAADFTFHSTSYDWLVVAGAKAQYKGSGTVNGDGDYGFMLTAVDGQVGEKEAPDLFRLKVWEKATGAIVYDNKMGAPDTDDPTTAIGGGSIVVHK